MMQHNTSQKAQKGWLSRWTRKQWSRHWFVLKNGSLTYYRGPAAELCSFLDGVLDLSLIKHIEVTTEEAQQPGQQHNHTGGSSNNHHHSSANNASQQQFTFSLKMWNGECHLLGASSVAERSLWLEAIHACTSADDDAATDSASSSDSSPTSNLSGRSGDLGARRHWNQRQQEQLALDQLALSLRSAVARRREQELVLELNASPESKKEGEAEAKPVRHSLQPKQEAQVERQQQASKLNKQQDQAEPSQLSSAQAERSSQEDREQAFKRRLMCVQSSGFQQRESAQSEPKLITRRQASCELPLKPTYGYLSDSGELEMNSASSSSGSESELDSDHEADAAQEPAPESRLRPVGSSEGQGKQKKRVTFDLSLSSQHQLSASSDSSGEDSLSSAASDGSCAASSSSSEDELEELEAPSAPDCGDLIDLSQCAPAAPPAEAAAEAHLAQPPTEDAGGSEPMEVHHWRQLEAPDGGEAARLRLTDELESKLERAQTDIGLLEARLSSSYASHSQLELSYKRLQADLLKGDELHRLELARLEARVEELTRELAAGELKLAEAREKLLAYEQRIATQQANRPQSPVKQTPRSMSLNNWLRGSQQVVQVGGQSQKVANQHHHLHLQQPLLLMHHVKHSLTANQQTLGLKLLNHSKQIQRKLNELELKVDKIQSAVPEAASAPKAVN